LPHLSTQNLLQIPAQSVFSIIGAKDNFLDISTVYITVIGVVEFWWTYGSTSIFCARGARLIHSLIAAVKAYNPTGISAYAAHKHTRKRFHTICVTNCTYPTVGVEAR
jgi:hypothetical protein